MPNEEVAVEAQALHTLITVLGPIRILYRGDTATYERRVKARWRKWRDTTFLWSGQWT